MPAETPIPAPANPQTIARVVLEDYFPIAEHGPDTIEESRAYFQHALATAAEMARDAVLAAEMRRLRV